MELQTKKWKTEVSKRIESKRWCNHMTLSEWTSQPNSSKYGTCVCVHLYGVRRHFFLSAAIHLFYSLRHLAVLFFSLFCGRNDVSYSSSSQREREKRIYYVFLSPWSERKRRKKRGSYEWVIEGERRGRGESCQNGLHRSISASIWQIYLLETESLQ